ncbi:hypothetical protein WJX79_003854 [Trebouxia sp. C0005]
MLESTSMYAAKDTSRLFLLRQELASLRKKPEEAMAVYLARSKDLMADLVAVGSESQEAEIVLSVLVGLPEEFGMAVEVLSMADSLDSQTVVPRLLQAEQRVRRQRSEHFGDVPVYGASYHQGVKKCHLCKQPGHLRANCPQRGASKQHGALKCDYCGKAGLKCDYCGRAGHEEGLM